MQRLAEMASGDMKMSKFDSSPNGMPSQDG